MFQLSFTPLETMDLYAGLRCEGTGALCVFEGLVRKHHEDKIVIGIEYEGYVPLCQTEANLILEETIQKFKVLSVRCYHRLGWTKVGEMAVWIGVAASHRLEGFQACRHVIDEIKSRVPIWKKEFYQNGPPNWPGRNLSESQIPSCPIAKADHITTSNQNNSSDFKQDPSGFYVLIRVNRELLRIEAALCGHDQKIIQVFHGVTSNELYRTILRHEHDHAYQWFNDKSHVAYLGKELTLAELALKSGHPYVQD